MTFPEVTIADWRAQVERELAGAPFDKTLVHTTAEGLEIQPLYTEARAEAAPPGVAPFTRGASAAPAPFRICMRHEAFDAAALIEDLEGGADALWLRLRPSSAPDLDGVLSQAFARRTFLWIDAGESSRVYFQNLVASAERKGIPVTDLRFALAADPIGGLALGRPFPGTLAKVLDDLGRGARLVNDRCPLGTSVAVSTLPYHDAGCDDADELALGLSTAAAYLGALLDAGLEITAAARQIAVQISIGRDTFVELAKLRALRLCFHKLFAAAGAPEVPLRLLHAVCSSRTLTERDPWVNMLRVTTQLFAAALGGADLVTPASFDEALGPPGALGRRLARNTGLVLREESYLGKVVDPAGGSYYLEAITDELAREAWRRFQELEKQGGVVEALRSGRLRAQLEASWRHRREQIVNRKEPITGVSEFANLDEKRPDVAPRTNASPQNENENALPLHRDAEPFEILRARAEALARTGDAPEVLLVTLGPAPEHRARVGFAAGLFAAGGLRARESATIEKGALVCLCGSDDRYAAEAADRARALKAAGAGRLLLAGRPGPLESSLRAAGVDAFIFVGCDVVSVLTDLLDAHT